jgi:hypothetical protein
MKKNLEVPSRYTQILLDAISEIDPKTARVHKTYGPKIILRNDGQLLQEAIVLEPQISDLQIDADTPTPWKKLKIEKTRNNIEYTKQSIDFQAATARTTLKNALLQIQSQKRNLDLSNSVLDLAQRKYKAGVGSNLEVTTAQTDLLRSQNNYFAALLEAINAEADLKKALGLLK